MSRNVQIGFSQRIQVEWLEMTANLVLASRTRSDIQTVLDNFLQDKLSIGSNTKSTNRRKAISILLRIWVGVPKHLEPLRNEGLEHLRRLPNKQHLSVHWGMTMAVYPFFGVVAETVGRLVGLQGAFAAASVQRRIKEQLGDKETVSRAARRVLRCFVDWGVLQDTNEKGIYQAVSLQFLEDKELASWLIEAAFVASKADTGSIGAIAQSYALFPFIITQFNLTNLEVNQRLELFRQGLDENMIALRKN
ncbi:MAG: hypothetical protein NVS2B14_08610 [Chamaesiphon sp.]